MTENHLSTLTQHSEPGVYTMKTRTGSNYEISIGSDKAITTKRLPADDGEVLRYDGEVWRVSGEMKLNVGSRGFLVMYPMAKNAIATFRTTSEVTEILKVS